jgi:hypothetical protein
VSYEEFGGIVYHYGRWLRVDGEGWCWSPDYQWGPAWVSWRTSDDYVGWAPLPPEARWRHDVGFGVWADSAYDIGPGYYSFCHVRDFGAPVLRPVLIDPGQNVAIIRGTVNVTNISFNSGFAGGGVVFNGGPRFEAVSAVVAHPIPRLKLVTNANIDPASWRNHKGGKGVNGFASQTVGNQLIVSAPRVLPPADPAAFKAKAKIVYTADRVSKGWAGVKSPETRQELRDEIHRQAKGLTPESAPAHAVAATDLKVVPSVGDAHAKSSLNVPGEPHEKAGKDRHPENVVVAPANVPPSGKPGSQLPPAGKGSAIVENPAQEQGGFRGGDEGRNMKDKKGKDKQIAPQQEDARRREFEAQQQPPQQQRVVEGGRGKDSEKEKDHKNEKFESPRANQVPPPVQRGIQVPGAQPPGGSPQSGHHSKDSKDKEKDKNNGN